MAHKSYSEKLRDPRWQKVRLEVLERAGWKCEGCGDATSTLSVHHGYYERGKEPWEYDSGTLWSLCEECHEQAEIFRSDLYWEAAHLNPLAVSPHRISRSRTAVDREISRRRGDFYRSETFDSCFSEEDLFPGARFRDKALPEGA